MALIDVSVFIILHIIYVKNWGFEAKAKQIEDE